MMCRPGGRGGLPGDLGCEHIVESSKNIEIKRTTTKTAAIIAVCGQFYSTVVEKKRKQQAVSTHGVLPASIPRLPVR